MKCQFCPAEIQPPRKTLCEDCERKWNAGAAYADAHWAEYSGDFWEYSPSGEMYMSDRVSLNANAIYARDKAAAKAKK